MGEEQFRTEVKIELVPVIPPESVAPGWPWDANIARRIVSQVVKTTEPEFRD